MLEHFAECVESVVATAAALPVPPHDTTFPQSMERIAERVVGNLHRAGHFREEYAWQQPAGDEAAALYIIGNLLQDDSVIYRIYHPLGSKFCLYLSPANNYYSCLSDVVWYPRNHSRLAHHVR